MIYTIRRIDSGENHRSLARQNQATYNRPIQIDALKLLKWVRVPKYLHTAQLSFITTLKLMIKCFSDSEIKNGIA